MVLPPRRPNLKLSARFDSGDQGSQGPLPGGAGGLPASTDHDGPGTALQVAPVVRIEEQMNDVGNAELLIRHFGGEVRYVIEAKRWQVWDDRRWRWDDGETAMYEYAKAAMEKWKEIQWWLMANHRYPEASKIPAWISTSLNHGKLTACIKLASKDPRVAISAASLDSDPWILGVGNGVIDLKTGIFRPGRPEDAITKYTDGEYDASATCPRWEKFLLEIMDGDTEMVRYLQKMVGYCLSGSTREQRLFLLYGYGANGKSTFVNILLALLGRHSNGYGKAVDIHALMARTRGSNGPTPEIAKLKGLRLAVGQEIPEGDRLDESLVKSLTGGDLITARELYSSPIEFYPTHKLIITGNHKPNIRGTDHGIWRRIDLIGFRRVFKPSEQDKDLEAKLLEELPGILNWTVEGCKLWQAEGLERPRRVREETEAFRTEQDILQHWLDEACDTTDSTAWTPLKSLYKEFRDWARDANEWEMRQRTFSQKLEEKGFRKVRRAGGVGFEGIKPRFPSHF